MFLNHFKMNGHPFQERPPIEWILNDPPHLPVPGQTRLFLQAGSHCPGDRPNRRRKIHPPKTFHPKPLKKSLPPRVSTFHGNQLKRLAPPHRDPTGGSPQARQRQPLSSNPRTHQKGRPYNRPYHR